MKNLLLILTLLLILNSYAFGDERQFDTLKMQFEEQKQTKDYRGMVLSIMELRQVGVELPESMLYDEAEAYYKTDQSAYAHILLKQYIEKVGENGKHYGEVLALLKQTETHYNRYALKQSTALQARTVIDVETGLMWQDDISVKEVKMSWHGAKKYCTTLITASYNDWRLPNYDELLSIVDYSRAKPAIKDMLINTAFSGYWSSSSDASSSGKAWYALFSSGETYSYRKSDLNYVRCVRNDNAWSNR